MKKVFVLTIIGMFSMVSWSWAYHPGPACKTKRHFKKHHRYDQHSHRFKRTCDHWCELRKTHRYKHAHRYPRVYNEYKSRNKHGHYSHRRGHTYLSFGSIHGEPYYHIGFKGQFHK